MSARGSQDFVGHVHLSIEDAYAGAPVNNIIRKAITAKGAWVEQACASIGDERAIFRSTYLRWALAINGLHVAAERYAETTWQRTHECFVATSLRVDATGQAKVVRVAEWDGETAAKNHLRTQPMLVAYGIIDLAACFEEWVFALYRCYLNQYPQSLIRGDEYKDLRRLWKKADGNPAMSAEWTQRWTERVNAWQKKRAYHGLDAVFRALLAEAGLKRPASYQHTDVNTWAESLRLVVVLRNLLIHGVDEANDELEQLSAKPYSLGYDFKAGDSLELELRHLQAVECFAEQLLTAVNLSLVEHPDSGS